MPIIPKSETSQAILFALLPGTTLQQWQGHYELQHQKGKLREVANWLRDLLEHDIEPAARAEETRLADKARFELHQANQAEQARVAAIMAMIPPKDKPAVIEKLMQSDEPAGKTVETSAANTVVDNVTQHLFPID